MPIGRRFLMVMRKVTFSTTKTRKTGSSQPAYRKPPRDLRRKILRNIITTTLGANVLRPLKKELSEYYSAAIGLAKELLGWVEQYSPEDIAKSYSQPLSNMIKDSEQTLLRILHYPPITGDEEPDAIRAAAHEDINLLTILPAANEPGLQVKGKDGEWLDVPSDFGNLIINIGDMLQEASSGYFPSTTHRVINPSGSDMSKSRISLPLFLHPRPDVETVRATHCRQLSERTITRTRCSIKKEAFRPLF